MRTKLTLLLCLCLSLSIASNKVYSLSGDTDQPMVFEAAQIIIDDKTGNHVWTGNVTMTQGSIIIKAEKLEVLSKEGQAVHLIATGKQSNSSRAIFQQTMDDQTIVKASSHKLEYYERKSHLKLTGNAELQRDRDLFKGQKIDYNTKTHRLIAGTPILTDPNTQTSEPLSKDRVRVIIYPKRNETDKPDSGK